MRLVEQELGTEVPKFDNDDRQEGFARLQRSHQVLMAVQALTRQFRIELKERKQYQGSKLELMDIYGVKLSELSAWPFYVGEMDPSTVPDGFYDKNSQQRRLFKRETKKKERKKKEKTDNETPAKHDRPKRNVRKRDDDDYVE